jgi:hypothetical protein
MMLIANQMISSLQKMRIHLLRNTRASLTKKYLNECILKFVREMTDLEKLQFSRNVWFLMMVSATIFAQSTLQSPRLLAS